MALRPLLCLFLSDPLRQVSLYLSHFLARKACASLQKCADSQTQSIDFGENKNFQRKVVNIFYPIRLSICFGCSKEPFHRDGSFDYPQHMFLMRNKKVIILLRTLN